jgi:acyl-CoA thioesterase-1
LGDKPDIVLIELGANDALRGTDPAVPERNLAATIEKLKAAGVTVWLAGMMAPRNFGQDYVAAFDGIYQRLSDKYQVPLYPFILDGVAQDPALNQPDGLHPNVQGAQIIADKLMPFAAKNLDAYAQTVHRPPRP